MVLPLFIFIYMAYTSLQEFIKILDQNNELLHVDSYVSQDLEMAEVIDRMSKSEGGGKALFFKNNGSDFPVLANAMGSENRICRALGVKDLNELALQVEYLMNKVMTPKTSMWEKLKLLPELYDFSKWMPKTIKGRGRSQEVINRQPNLNILPALKCWPYDGGRFITLPLVITKDPETGIRNTGMYRMQIFSSTETGMHWHRHKGGAQHYDKYKKRNQMMPVAVALGGDPAITYSATAPLPDNIDEFLLAGFLRKKNVQLVPAITQDIEVPADADIIIEGYIDPSEPLVEEGPFGDHTGFYSLKDLYPKLHVTCITHRKDAVYPATLVGIPPQEDLYISKATEKIFLFPIRIAVAPEIKDMSLPSAGVSHNLTLVSIKKRFPGNALKVAHSMWGGGQMMFNKVIVVVDDEIDVHNKSAIEKAFRLNFSIDNSLHFSQGPLDVLDHSSNRPSYGSKLCIDLTSADSDEQSYTMNSIKPLSCDCTPDDLPEYQVKEVAFGGLQAFIVYTKVFDKDLLAFLSEKQMMKEQHVYIFSDTETYDLNQQELLWFTLGNIDPARDIKIYKNSLNISLLAIDGMKKRPHQNNFNRDWPNVVLADKKTIKAIDKKWTEMGFGEFIESPSEKYSKLSNSDGAIEYRKDLNS
jgi:4-hydroxy-3-polyprenylbenzoate decarboxylase